jgi:hypothetical protein
MFAFNGYRDCLADDGPEPIPPLAQVGAARGSLRGFRDIQGPLAGVIAGGLIAILLLLAGPAAQALVLALGGTAALLYLGTALLSGRRIVMALDLGAAAAAAGIALAAPSPAVTVLLVHVVWGILRGSWPEAAPGRRFATAWAALNASAVLLFGLGM